MNMNPRYNRGRSNTGRSRKATSTTHGVLLYSVFLISWTICVICLWVLVPKNILALQVTKKGKKMMQIQENPIMFLEKNIKINSIWRCWVSNPGPSACKADALPLSYIPCLDAKAYIELSMKIQWLQQHTYRFFIRSLVSPLKNVCKNSCGQTQNLKKRNHTASRITPHLYSKSLSILHWM